MEAIHKFVVLNVAEKPSVARQLTREFTSSAFKKVKSFSKINPVFQFEGEFFSQKCSMFVTSVCGHIMELNFPSTYKHWSSSDLMMLLDAKSVKSGSYNIVETLKFYAKQANIVALWLDCDREGENIAFEVATICQQTNKKIKVVRPRFSSISYAELTQATQNPPYPNFSLSSAVDCRQELDFRTGALLTRFLTLRYQKNYPIDLLSFGLCQIPTLGLVTARFKEREAFFSEDFWFLEFTYTNAICSTLIKEETIKKTQTTFFWERHQVFDENVGKAFEELCRRSSTAYVDEVTKKQVIKKKPMPLTTNELTILASQKLHIPSRTTMQIAEALYQKGYISYPRTETNAFSDDIDLQRLFRLHVNNPSCGTFVEASLQNGCFEKPRRGYDNDNAHPPIHPIRSCSKKDFANSSYWKDAVGVETEIRLNVAGEFFKAHNLTIIERNFLEIYFFFDSWIEKPIPLHEFIKGRSVKGLIRLKQGKTTAPNLLTEAELIRAMNKYGIGTDATVHEHIFTIQQRRYVDVISSRFQPSILGYRLISGLKFYAKEQLLDLTHPTLRATIESDISLVANGQALHKEIVARHLMAFREITTQILNNPQYLDTFMLSDETFGSLITQETSSIISKKHRLCRRREK